MTVNKRFSPETYLDWAALYLGGDTLQKISDDYGVSKQTVSYHLRKQGVSIRSNSVSHMHDIKKFSATLSEDAKQILIGSTIGDGSIRKQTTGAIMQLAHAHNQRGWLEYKADLLRDIASPKGVTIRDGIGNRQDIVEFRTLPHIFIDDLHSRSYLDDGERSIRSIIPDLKPLGLAVLWGDDGCFGENGSHQYGILSVCRYSFEDNAILSSYLETEFNIKNSVLKKKVREKVYPQIRISKSGMTALRDAIYDFLPEQMKYKIGGA